MDNITHSLVGLLTAESALAALRIKNPDLAASRRTKISFWLTAFIANNFCDLDFIYAMFLKPSRLQYLLHHRGHTHTFVMIPLQVALIFSGFWILGRTKKISWERTEIIGMTLLSFLGVTLHLLLDSLNQYGVHPFWPFYNGWFYADMMFIVEPWIWMTLLPLIFFATVNRWLRMLVVSLVLGGLGLVWLTGYVPYAIATFVTLWTVFLVLVFLVFGNHTRLMTCYVALILVFLVFLLESQWLKREVRDNFEKEQPGVVVNDVILSPFPSNPICWQIVTVETAPQKTEYRLRRGVISIFSNLYRPEECLTLVSKQKEFEKKHPQVIWTTQMKYSLRELRELYQSNCLIRAQLKFVRAPFWNRDKENIAFADLRFETGNRGNFSKMVVPEHPKVCPQFIPPWEEPRRDLLIP